MLSRFKNMRIALIAATTTAAVLASSAAHAELIVGLSTTNAIFNVDSANVNNIALGSYNGLIGFANPSSEQAISVDYRPVVGGGYTLLSVGERSATDSTVVGRLYDVDITTGFLTNVREIAGTGVTFNSATRYTIDYNPTGPVALRILGSDGSNYRVGNPVTGVAVADTALTLNGNPATNIVGAAYSNNFIGSTATTLYDFNAAGSTLLTQVANAGTLTTVGSLGIGLDVAGLHELDISGPTATLFGSFQLSNEGFSRFYTVNTTNGLATATAGNNAFRVAGAPANLSVRGFSAVSVIPEASTFALIAPVLGVIGAVVVRRRKIA